MGSLPYGTALIVGAGTGISASFARALAAKGVKVALAARDVAKLAPFAEEIGAVALPVDASDPAAVQALFSEVESRIGVPEIVLYNASGRVRGAIAELDPEAVRRAIEVSAFGASSSSRRPPNACCLGARVPSC